MPHLLMFWLLVTLLFSQSFAQTRFGERLCHHPDYFCLKIKYGENWDTLFPTLEAQDVVKRINRLNVALKPGFIIAIPKNLDKLTIYDVAPFLRYINSQGEKTIYISQKNLAWAAYDAQGELIWWGPISPGMSHCGARGECHTPSGAFRIIRKQDIDCISTAFPVRADGNNGGAAMPYCMHFFRGFALHGSSSVPGFPASHGCVRMFIEDAQWLNEEFIELPGNGFKGTRVIIDALET